MSEVTYKMVTFFKVSIKRGAVQSADEADFSIAYFWLGWFSLAISLTTYVAN